MRLLIRKAMLSDADLCLQHAFKNAVSYECSRRILQLEKRIVGPCCDV